MKCIFCAQLYFIAMLFVVLKCYQCLVFQVHQSKKSKKWICKLCGAKQSLLKIYYEGSASSCRQVVQTSNLKKRETEIFSDVTNDFHTSDAVQNERNDSIKKCNASKWNAFKTTRDEVSSDEELDFNHLSTSHVNKRRRNDLKQMCVADKRVKKDEYRLNSSSQESNHEHFKTSTNVANVNCKIKSSVSSEKSKWSRFRSDDVVD